VAGNESDPTAGVADTSLDLTAPDAPVIDGFDGTTVEGTAEAGSTITVYDENGTEIGSGTADSAGNYSVAVAPSVADGGNINVTATDVAGNESDPTAGVADTSLDIKAVDDLDEVLISPDNPLSTLDNLNGTVGQTFAIANADLVSGLIDLSLLTSNEDFNFEVEPNTTQSVTIGVSGSTGLDLSSLGGVLAGLAASLLLGKSYTTQADIYLINAETGEIVDVASDQLTLTPLPLTTTISASNVQFDNIPPGNYTVAFSSTDPDSILGALLNAIADVGLLEGITVTITDSEQFYGASITGNVLDNDDDEGEHGGVVVPATVVGVVSEVISTEQSVDPSQPTVIQGQHGVLTIESDGSYTYVPNNLISSLGKVDTFTYTIDDGQHQSTANLNIRITQDGLEVVWDDDNPTADGVIPNDIDAVDDLETANWTTEENNLGNLSGATFALANVGAIFDTIGGSLLSSTNEFVLNVAENTLQDLTVNVSGTTGLDIASIGSTLAGLLEILMNPLEGTYETFADIYLIDLNTGAIVQTAEGALKLTPTLLTTTITAENVAFNNVPPGNYTIGFSSTDADSILGALLNAIANVGVLEGVDVTVSSSKLYVYGNVEGNVFDNDDITFDHVGEVVVTAIASETTAEQGVFNVAKSIQGQHGTLTISQDGSFKYVGNGDPASLGKVDSFTYTLSDGIHSDTAVLNIRTTADGLDVIWGANDADDGTISFDAVDDVENLTIAVRNVVNEDVNVPVTTTGTVATTYTDNTTIAPAYTRTFTNTFNGSQVFTVNPDTTVTGTVSINVGLVSSSIGDLSNSWGTVTATYTISGPNGVIENGSGSLVREVGLRGDYIATADFTNLPAGSYTISYNVTNVTTATGSTGVGGIGVVTPSNNGAFTVDPAVVKVDQIMLNEYEPVVPGTYSVVGDILGNDIASDFAKLEIVQGENTYILQNEQIYVNGILQNTNSVDIAGAYGTLNLKADGTYTYTASTATNVWGNTEEFTYTLTDAGQTDTAVISIELVSDNPAAMTVSSARMALADSDTVIFDLLDNTDDRGGNDLQTLDDFDSTQGDQIDVSALLSDQSVDNSTLGNYVSLEQRGDDTVVTIDRDGSSTDQTFARADLLILSNTNAQDLILQDLIKYQS
ncbi:Ig-like domain-containing protein, partial [Acinetobacter amyesii]|uniref:Ig-like domain-containing protein n=1 Tax=Acinetobacter amyesii TaxID=2942470 RepID=UPI003F039C8E